MVEQQVVQGSMYYRRFASCLVYFIIAPTSNQIYPSCSSNAMSEYVVEYVPTDSGCATFYTINMYTDTVLAVYEDCPSTGLEMACDDDSGSSTYGSSLVSADVVAGETYYVVLEGKSSSLVMLMLHPLLMLGSLVGTGVGTTGGSTSGGTTTCDDSCYAANDGYCDDVYDANTMVLLIVWKEPIVVIVLLLLNTDCCYDLKCLGFG